MPGVAGAGLTKAGPNNCMPEDWRFTIYATPEVEPSLKWRHGEWVARKTWGANNAQNRFSPNRRLRANVCSPPFAPSESVAGKVRNGSTCAI